MEIVTTVQVSNLSRTEQRKIKLAQYLAAKGKLKPPNPKSYLKDKPAEKKPTEKRQTARTAGDGKENCRSDVKASSKGATALTVAGKLRVRSDLAPLQTSQNSRRTAQSETTAVKNKSASLQNPAKVLKREGTAALPLKTHKSLPNKVSQQASHAAEHEQTSEEPRDGSTRSRFGYRSISQSRVKPPQGQADLKPSSGILVQSKIPRRTQSHIQTKALKKETSGSSRVCFAQPLVQKSTSVSSRPEQKQITSQKADLHRNAPLKPPWNSSSHGNAPSGSRTSAPLKPNHRVPAAPPQTPTGRRPPSTHGVRMALADQKKRTTAAQEDRLRKLQVWRESRGITYKRPPMPVRVVRRKTVVELPQPYWTQMEAKDEARELLLTVESSLDDCLQLLQQGVPASEIRDVLSRVPMAQHFEKYWICRARLMESEGDLEVLPLFLEAVRVLRQQPVDELRQVVFLILKKTQVPPEEVKMVTPMLPATPRTPKPVSAHIYSSRGESSGVKYKITTTPGGKKCEARRMDGREIRFITPVRRSVRIERSSRRYPAGLQEHDLCVTSHRDLKVKDDFLYVYRENDALQDRVQVKLVYAEETDT